MKKILILFLIITLLFSFCACSSPNEQPSEPIDETTNQDTSKLPKEEQDFVDTMVSYMNDKYSIQLNESDVSYTGYLFSDDAEKLKSLVESKVISAEEIEAFNNKEVSRVNLPFFYINCKKDNRHFSCVINTLHPTKENCFDNYQFFSFVSGLVANMPSIIQTETSTVLVQYNAKELWFNDDSMFNGCVNEKLPENSWEIFNQLNDYDIVFSVDALVNSQTSVKDITQENIDAFNSVNRVIFINCSDVTIGNEIFSVDENFINTHKNAISEYYVFGSQYKDTPFYGYHN